MIKNVYKVLKIGLKCDEAEVKNVTFSGKASGLWFLVQSLDDLLDRRGVIQGAEVTQALHVSLRNFPQHPSHYLTRARLWQALDKLQEGEGGRTCDFVAGPS